MSTAIILGPAVPDEEPQRVTPGADSARLRGILNPTLVALAREIAQDIREVNDILVDYGFDGAEDPRWRSIYESRDFKTALHNAVQEWNAADSTPKRVRYKAAASVEAALPALHAIMLNDAVAVTGRVEVFRQMSRLAGMADGAVPREGAGGGGSGFQLTINIGEGKGVTLRTAPVIEGESEE